MCSTPVSPEPPAAATADSTTVDLEAVVSGASSRRKGVTFEQEVARYLGTVTTRSTRPGIHDDAGDVVVTGWFLECKNHGRLELGPWLDKAERLAGEFDAELTALVVKRRNRFIGHSFVVMTLDTFKELL